MDNGDDTGATLSLLENTAGVIARASVSADFSLPSYNLDAVSVAAGFSINSTTGEITVSALDFENQPTGFSSDVITLTVTVTGVDSSETYSEDIEVTLLDITEDIIFSSGSVGSELVDNGDGTGASVDLLENTAGVVAQASALVDFSSTLSYNLDTASILAGFTINGSTGVITAPSLDFENLPFDLSSGSLLSSLNITETIYASNIVDLQGDGYDGESIIFAGGFNTTSNSSQLIYEAGGGTFGTALRIDNIGGQLTFVVSTGSEGDIDISSDIAVNTDYVYIVEITGATGGSAINLYIAEGRSLSALDGTTPISESITASNDLSGSDAPSYLSVTSTSVQGDGIGSLGTVGDFQGQASPILFFSNQAVDTTNSELVTSSGNDLTLRVTVRGGGSEVYSENIVVNILDIVSDIAFSSSIEGSNFVDNGDSTGASLTLQENTGGIIAQASASVDFSSALSYSLDAVSLAAGFSINATTGEITVSALDFENQPTGFLGNSLTLTVTVTGGSSENHSEELVVTVSDIVSSMAFSQATWVATLWIMAIIQEQV